MENRRFRFDLYMTGPLARDHMQAMIEAATALEDDENKITSMTASLMQDNPAVPPPKSKPVQIGQWNATVTEKS